MSVTVLDHPLAHHLLTCLRDETTEPEAFRTYAKRLTTLLVLEATKDAPTAEVEVQTPLEKFVGQKLEKGIAAVPILRAGLAMLEPVVELFPDVKVGYIGLERNDETAMARSYYEKLPKLEGRFTLCLDPMLATGGSAAQAISFMKSKLAGTIVMVCVVAAPQGVENLLLHHPEVRIVTASIDRDLNAKKYILPGLGDFGDRLYGTF